MSNRSQIGIALVLVAAAAGAVMLAGDADASGAAAEAGHDHGAVSVAAEARPVLLDPVAARRIGLTFATAERRALEPDLTAPGTVEFDETRVSTVNPKIEGWVERLHVDFTGAPVRKGQPLMEIYSPGLVSAQEELLLARRLSERTDPAAVRAGRNADQLLASARRRLAYWDIPEDDIRRIEETGEVRKTLTLRSPSSGIVIEKNVVEGDRIMPGMTVFRIVDLSTVWIEAEVFEKDLGLVRLGQRAEARFEAYPGQVFHGSTTYVYPTVSVQSRTGRVRLELSNPDLLLKPGMYAEVRVDVPAGEPVLVVPRSALLVTGERTLVFVATPDGMLTPREVTTGRVAGDAIELLDGVREGERVVSSANFLVDAEANLGAAIRDLEGRGGDAGAAPPTGVSPPMEMGGDSGTARSQGSSQSGHEGHGPEDA